MKVVALNTYGFEYLWKWWLWTPMALNAYESGGSRSLSKMGWLWKTELKKSGIKCLNEKMAFNAYETDGSKRL